MNESRMEGDEEKRQVEETKDAKLKRRKRVGDKCEKGDTLVIKTEQSKCWNVWKAMRSGAKLVHLGDDVRSIRRTHMGEMILELKHEGT